MAKTPCSQSRGPGVPSLVKELDPTYCNSRVCILRRKVPHATTETWCSQINKNLKKKSGQKASKGDGEGVVSTGERQPGHSGSWSHVSRDLQGYVRYSRESNKKNDPEMITRLLRGHWNLGEISVSPFPLPKSFLFL